MKIAISSQGKDESSLLDLRFGRCEIFYIYNTENNENFTIKNQGSLASGGAGIVAAQQIVDENVEVIITGNLGPNALEIIEKAKIMAYKSDVKTIENVISDFKNNSLDEIKYAGPSHNGM